ncbi:hypothetical protein HT102_05715 [Hoyosella sp. G463]|uniref:Uncharacterized protein n=1 Tax=Lolliginicoccus lacisalsi TaxID=2742202 RepID=A0A927JBD0_9ACTN|nr:hypothetical protein [Lolliginicoccus lacisalsi]MBD8505978.1 hypothetical protein [Lolliginicoccus lacisalsi]
MTAILGKTKPDTSNGESTSLADRAKQAGSVAANPPVQLSLIAARKLRKSGKNEIDTAPKASKAKKPRRSRKVRAAQILIGTAGAVGLAGLAAYMAKHWDELSDGGPEMPKISLGYDSQT